MATDSSILAWRIPGAEEPGGLPSMGSHRVGHGWSDLAAAAELGRAGYKNLAPILPSCVTQDKLTLTYKSVLSSGKQGLGAGSSVFQIISLLGLSEQRLQALLGIALDLMTPNQSSNLLLASDTQPLDGIQGLLWGPNSFWRQSLPVFLADFSLGMSANPAAKQDTIWSNSTDLVGVRPPRAGA